jgi:hypothetical protein
MSCLWLDQCQREKMGLPNPESRAWRREEVSELGTATEAKVAERIGRTASAVVHKRWSFGIPAARWQTSG